MPKKFMFIEALPPGASTRDQELQISEMRKHAAMVSHPRNRRQSEGSESLASSSPASDHVHETSLSSALTTKSLPWRHAETQPADKRHLIIARSRPSRRSMHQSKPNKSHQADRTPQIKLEEEDPEQRAEHLRSVWARDFKYLEKSSRHMDPFYRIPHNNASSFFRATEYFTQVIVPNNYPIYQIFEVSNVYCSYTFDLHQVEHFLHAWVGAMNLIRSTMAPQTQSADDALRHTGVAMAQLRRALSDPNLLTHDYTISSVLFLVLLSKAYGDMAGYEMHRRNLIMMIAARGGLDALGLDGVVKCTILQWDCFWALDAGESMFPESRTLQKPIYPGPPPFAAEVSATVRQMPRGFQRLAYQGYLALDVIHILGRVADAHAMYGPGQSHEQRRTPSWQRSKHNDFWECCACLAEPGLGLEKAICLTLLLYCTNQFSPVRKCVKGMTVYNGPRAFLTKNISLIRASEASEKDCLVWMWMVLIDSWRSDDGLLLSSGDVLLMQLRRRFPDLRAWSKLNGILGKFFYPEPFAVACKTIWESSPFGEDIT